VIYSRGNEHRQGVAFILNKQPLNSIMVIWPKSERILLVKLKSSPFNLNIIVATADSDDETICNFYAELEEVSSSASRKISIL